MTSSRLPGKVLMKAGGKPLLQILIERLQLAQSLDSIVVATTTNDTDLPIVELCHKLGISFFRGSEENVLERVCGAGLEFGADTLVEITADCPLIDPKQVDHAVRLFKDSYPDSLYVSNSSPLGNAPDGMNVQVFKLKELLGVLHDSPDEMDREHVSYRFYRPESGKKYRPKFIKYESPCDRPDIFVTLDFLEDYDLIKAIYEDLAESNPLFSLEDVVRSVDLHGEKHSKCIKRRGIKK